jgi:alpha-galactosidase
MRNFLYIKFLTIFFVISINAYSQKNPTLATTPPMGWNSWNWFGKKEVNEQNMKECMDAIVKEGLLGAGYNYFIIDGGWRDKKLGANGELLANTDKFPHGMKAMADYAHSKGLKFGLHIVPGTHDCGGDPVGGFGHEEVHVRQLTDWGIDFVKLDLCKQKSDPCSECAKNKQGWSENLIRETYLKWSKLLHNCGRDILFSVSAYEFRDWNPEYCNMSRTTEDIHCRAFGSWENKYYGASFDESNNEGSVMAIADINNLSAAYAGKGYWNDPDMMVTGEQGLSEDEQKCHFALWCIMSSPLILGNDPRRMTYKERELILNKEAIEIDQDPTEQGFRIHKSGNAEIWAKKLQNGNVAVLLLNRDLLNDTKIEFKFKEIGIRKKAMVRDLYLHKDIGVFKNSLTKNVNPHSCYFYLIERK